VGVKLACANAFTSASLCLIYNGGSKTIEKEWIFWLQDCAVNQDSEQLQFIATKVIGHL
jgi:hypothetical protein